MIKIIYAASWLARRRFYWFSHSLYRNNPNWREPAVWGGMGVITPERNELMRMPHALLMAVEHPSAEIIEAVDAAVAWLRHSQIHGLRVEEIPLPEEKIINHEYPFDRVTVEDAQAKPIWARFYETHDNTPFMCTRAGQKVWRLSDVDPERRTGYDWYGYWPEKILKRYAKWKRKVSRK